MAVKVYGAEVPAGCWQLAYVGGAWSAPTAEVEGLLAEGWEPFAIHDLDVWLRREVPDELGPVRAAVKAALEGDSNDAEHDALVEVAGYLGVAWDQEAARS